MAVLDELITKLRNVGQYLPTVERHREHVKACEGAGVEPDTFETFAVEVLNTPSDKRAWLLADEPTPEYSAQRRYRQYDTPTPAQMLAGLSPRKK